MHSQNRYLHIARWCAVAPLLWLAVFFTWPFTAIIRRGLQWSALADTLSDRLTWSILWFSTWQAALSVLVTFTVALPVTWVIGRYQFASRRALRTLVTLPFLLPTVVVAGAFIAVLPNSLNNTTFAIIIAHAYLNMAVVVRVVGAELEQLDEHTLDAARTLGASPVVVLRTIVLPLVQHSLRSAAVVVFLFCFTSYGVVRLLGGLGTSTLESEIALRILGLNDLPTATVLSLLQLLTLVVVGRWLINGTTSPIVGRSSGQLRNARAHRRMVGTIAVVTSVFVAAPLTALLARSLQVGGRWSTAGWSALLQNTALPSTPPLIGSITTSLQFAITTAAIALVLGVLASVAVVHTQRLGRFVDRASLIPLLASPVSLGLGMVMVFDSDFFNLRARWIAVPIAHSLIAIPIMLRLLVPVLRNVNPKLRDAAASLGARPIRALWSIDFALARFAMAGGTALVVAISLGEFGASSLLSRGTTQTMPVTIATLLSRTGDIVQTQGFVLAVILSIFSALALFTAESFMLQRVTNHA